MGIKICSPSPAWRADRLAYKHWPCLPAVIQVLGCSRRTEPLGRGRDHLRKVWQSERLTSYIWDTKLMAGWCSVVYQNYLRDWIQKDSDNSLDHKTSETSLLRTVADAEFSKWPHLSSCWIYTCWPVRFAQERICFHHCKLPVGPQWHRCLRCPSLLWAFWWRPTWHRMDVLGIQRQGFPGWKMCWPSSPKQTL